MAERVPVDELVSRLGMQPHPEGGRFAERHPFHEAEGRATSGAILYYLGPGEHSDFHQIDCDEYWCHIDGGDLELWMVSPEGELKVERLGLSEGAEPLFCIPSGSIFAARHADADIEGTLVSCITVPRFSYDGFRLVAREELGDLCGKALEFYDLPSPIAGL